MQIFSENLGHVYFSKKEIVLSSKLPPPIQSQIHIFKLQDETDRVSRAQYTCTYYTLLPCWELGWGLGGDKTGLCHFELQLSSENKNPSETTYEPSM